MRSLRRLVLLTLYSSLLTGVGCRVSMSPVKNRVAVGSESYVVFDAEGEEGEGDLYVGSASGGRAFRVTFTRVHESSPALSPDGVMLAFLRGPHAGDSAGLRIWVMNLLNGAEREVPELAPGAIPRKLAWSLDGRTIFVRTAKGDFQLPAPPSSPEPSAVGPTAQPAADTALGVPLGTPVVGLAGPCAEGICAITAAGSQVLSASGRGVFRWGSDSVGYFNRDEIEVRPLAGGTTRPLRWTGVPPSPRTATQFPGVGPNDGNR